MRSRKKVAGPRGEDEPPPPAPTLVGESPQMRRVRALIGLFGPGSEAVLITGESGTGKELVAVALNAASGRRPFLSANCATVEPALADSMLFGHERGAFTGAHEDRAGLFQQAAGGNLFLDEVGELHPAVQAKLLRALDPGEFSPVGSTDVIRTTTRLFAATNRDLSVSGLSSMRDDLLSRLTALRIHLPPLRERAGDIPLLVEHFLAGHSIDPGALRELEEYRWTRGNVRELKAVLARTRQLAAGSPIRRKHLRGSEEAPGGIPPPGEGTALGGSRTLKAVTRRHVRGVLEEEGGNRSAAARVLGIDRRTLYRMLARWETGGDGA